jgi:hypothetical protein
METQTAPSSESPKSSGNTRRVWIIVAAVIVVIVVVLGGIFIYKKTQKNSSGPAYTPAGKISKSLYKAWQNGDRVTAAKYATSGAVTQMFALSASQSTGLTFGHCRKISDKPFPKQCLFTRPGGTLTMTLTRAPKQDPRVAAVVVGPAGVPPTSSTTG